MLLERTGSPGTEPPAAGLGSDALNSGPGLPTDAAAGSALLPLELGKAQSAAGC